MTAAAAAPDQSEVTIGPTYKDAPELTPPAEAPRGTVYDLAMESKDSKFYPGLSKTQPGTVPYTRKVALYVPAGYVPGTPAPFIVVQDGIGYRNLLPPILDSLIAAKRLPPMLAILIASGGGDGKGSERGLEYDTVSGKYADFIEDEVLPRLRHDFKVDFTADPDGRATMGGSSGGACAFTMAWFHPERYHRVLTYSGTFCDNESPIDPIVPHGAWEYHEHLIPQSERKPIRMWLEVGENDNHARDPESTRHNFILANRAMAADLKAKGYDYRFVYALGARHVDARVRRQTLPDALEWLWAGYPPPTPNTARKD